MNVELMWMAIRELGNARDYIWLADEGGIGLSEEEILDRIEKAILAIKDAIDEELLRRDVAEVLVKS